MAEGGGANTGLDLQNGVPLDELAEGVPLAGHLGEEPILVVRRGDTVHAIGATCTHYGGPLAEGLIVGETVRCPWHHACFSLRTGEALGAPALNPIATWTVEVRDGRAFVGGRQEAAPLSSRGRRSDVQGPVVIVGAGAAGSAAAEWLRREGFGGDIMLVDPDRDAPYDRPNLSKDYLQGTAPEEWIPLRPAGFYDEHRIERVSDEVSRIDRERRVVRLESGVSLPYAALLLATGSTPRRLNVPGADREHVRAPARTAGGRHVPEDGTGAARVLTGRRYCVASACSDTPA